MIVGIDQPAVHPAWDALPTIDAHRVTGGWGVQGVDPVVRGDAGIGERRTNAAERGISWEK